MTNQELILGVMRAQGKADALDLRARAPGRSPYPALLHSPNSLPKVSFGEAKLRGFLLFYVSYHLFPGAVRTILWKRQEVFSFETR